MESVQGRHAGLLTLRASSASTPVSLHASVQKPDLLHQRCRRRASLITNSGGFSLQTPIHPAPPHLPLFLFLWFHLLCLSCLLFQRWLPEVCVSLSLTLRLLHILIILRTLFPAVFRASLHPRHPHHPSASRPREHLLGTCEIPRRRL